MEILHRSPTHTRLHLNATGADPNPDLRMYMYLEDDEAPNILMVAGKEDNELQVADGEKEEKKKPSMLKNFVVRCLRV